MEKALTLDVDKTLLPGMDFNFLRQTAIDYLQKIIGYVWTDYNFHDPGVTILEVLCYAITDLSYRLDFAIEDLLALPDGEENKQFFTIKEILPTNPITINDYRKLLMDIPTIKNVWLQPSKDKSQIYYQYTADAPKIFSKVDTLSDTAIAINGLYDIFIEAEYDVTEAEQAKLKNTIKLKFLQHRNLCEDIASINFLPKEKILIKAIIEVAHDYNANHLLAEIYFRLEQFISPQIHRYNLQEMLDKDYSIADIFSGPVLKNGFIDDVDLHLTEKKTELYISNLIAEIKRVSGVDTIVNIQAASYKNINPEDVLFNIWSVELDPNYLPILNIGKEFSDTVLSNDFSDGAVSDIIVRRQGVPCVIDAKIVRDKLKQLRLMYQNYDQSDTDQLAIPKGEYRYLADYTSIQNDFPSNYGLGENSLSNTEDMQRQAQVKQLQAYLLFFDQILANYFSQLDSLKDLLAVSQKKTSSTNQALLTNTYNFFSLIPVNILNFIQQKIQTDKEFQTYFPQLLTDIKDGKDLWKVLPEGDSLNDLKTLQRLVEIDEIKIERKNRFLNHLLARFAEQFSDEALMLYQQLPQMNSKGKAIILTENATAYKMLKAKSAFLEDYAMLSSIRNKAFDYTNSDAKNLSKNSSGLRIRVAKILDMLERQSDANNHHESFYFIEHILLRPRTSNVVFERFSAKEGNDAFSFQLSVVFFVPNIADADKFEHFKKIIKQVFIKETPAHINIYLHWFQIEQKENFETLYTDWRQSLSQFSENDSNENAKIVDEKSEKLLTFLPNFDRLAIN